MATNLALTVDIRGEIMAALLADAALLALIPNLYPSKTPADPRYPFGRMGQPTTTMQFIDGGNGTLFSAAYHVFVKASQAILDPEAHAADACAEIVRIIDAMEDISIGTGLSLAVYPRQTQVIQDGDADSYHGFVTFDADAS